MFDENEASEREGIKKALPAIGMVEMGSVYPFEHVFEHEIGKKKALL
jgi:hypothetical protein